MGAMSPWHWAIVLLVVVILFGSKKLPDAARGLGRSLRIFKSEVKEMNNDGKPSGTDVASTPVAPAQIDAPARIDTHIESTSTHPDAKSA